MAHSFEDLPGMVSSLIEKVDCMQRSLDEQRERFAPQEQPITRAELGKRLGCSNPTIIKLEKKKLINGFNVANERRYIYSEVIASLKRKG